MKLRLILTVFSLFVPFLGAAHFGSTGGWKTVNFPNPMTDPLKCGRTEVPRSSVCDPDKLISKETQDEIEGHINFIKSGQVAVAVVNRMDLSEFGTNVDKASELFCRSLHNSWGVGSKEKNDGVVVFLSIEDRAVYISTGDGMKNLLTKNTIESIIQRMKPFLRRADYGGAVLNCIVEIEMVLSGKIIPTSHTQSKSSSSKGDPFAIAFIVLLFGGAGAYSYYQQRKLKQMERGRIALDTLIREVDNTSKAEDGDKLFITTSCPICLESFPETSEQVSPVLVSADDVDTDFGGAVGENGDGSDSGSDGRSREDILRTLTPHPASPVFDAKTPAVTKLKPMALRCGHTFCNDCITTYLKTNEGKKCPICRFPVHADYDHLHQRQAPRPPGGPGSPTTGSGGTGGDDGTSCRSAQSAATTAGTAGGRVLEPLETEGAHRANQEPMYMNDEQTGFNQNTYTNWGTGGTYDSRGFGGRGPEIQYRLNRMRYLYPDVMTLQLLHNMNRAVDRNSISEMRSELSMRSAEVQHTVTQMREAAAKAARSSGSRGASGSSFGGGRSSGGGGGRW